MEYAEMNIKAARWVKGNFDRVYFNNSTLKSADVKVFAYADENGKAKVSVKAGYMFGQFAREVVDAIRAHVYCLDTYAALVAEIA